MPERGQGMAAGPLLPYALRFGLVNDDKNPARAVRPPLHQVHPRLGTAKAGGRAG